MKQKKPVLTISLLISNRPDTIPRCLDSLKLIMDEIPSELILIDTSKNEEIHNLLLNYTNQVYEFTWCQDFAKARNEGIKRAKGEWFLYLDDDEWIVEADEIIKFFESGKYKRAGSANVQIRNYMNPEYTKYADAWVTRLFRLEEGVRFEGKVHEYVYHFDDRQIFLQARVDHSGYIFDTVEKRRKHFERNSKILLELVEEEPINLRWQGQMVQEYRTVDEWESIVDFCQKHLEKNITFQNFMDQNHFCTLYAGLVEALMKLGRYEDAVDICEKGLKDRRSTDLLKAYIYINQAKCHFLIENYSKSEELVEKYLECYKRYRQNEASMQQQFGSLIVQHAFDKNYLDMANNISTYFELKKGKVQMFDDTGNDLQLSSVDAVFDLKFISCLVELMKTTENPAVFDGFMGNFACNATLSELLCAEVQMWEEKNDDVFLKLASIVAKIESKFWYVNYCRVVDAALRKNVKAIKKALDDMLQGMTNVFYLPERVYDIIENNGILVALLWDKIVTDNWQEQIQQFVAAGSVEMVNRVRAMLYATYKPEDWHVLGYELAVMERQIIVGPQGQVAEYYAILKNYAQLKLVFYHNFGNKAENIEDVPAEVRAAVKIQEYLELETKDKRLALGKLKEVVDICPAFAKGIGGFFHLYAELEKQQAEKQKQEMKELRNQIILQVQSMLSSGQAQAALPIIGQLKQMFPDDLEVAALGLEVRLKILD